MMKTDETQYIDLVKFFGNYGSIIWFIYFLHNTYGHDPLVFQAVPLWKEKAQRFQNIAIVLNRRCQTFCFKTNISFVEPCKSFSIQFPITTDNK